MTSDRQTDLQFEASGKNPGWRKRGWSRAPADRCLLPELTSENACRLVLATWSDCIFTVYSYYAPRTVLDSECSGITTFVHASFPCECSSGFFLVSSPWLNIYMYVYVTLGN